MDQVYEDVGVSRRNVIVLGLSLPAVPFVGQTVQASEALRSFGQHALRNLGTLKAKALLDDNLERLPELGTGGRALSDWSASDFRVGRTLTIGGILVSEAETVAALDLIRREGGLS